MKPQTLILDFDSTLIRLESLEEILSPHLTAAQREQMTRITAAGMNGQISFAESLEQRLQLAQPSLTAVKNFGQVALGLLADHLAELMTCCRKLAITPWILTGGLLEAVLPVSRSLGLPDERVLAIACRWDDTGRFLGLAPGTALDKVSACQARAQQMGRPVWAVGDGFTDYQLLLAGCADRFFAFTAFARRPFVAENKLEELADFATLVRRLMEEEHG
jgi:D-3-phosphoglycerate dehydrogenase